MKVMYFRFGNIFKFGSISHALKGKVKSLIFKEGFTQKLSVKYRLKLQKKFIQIKQNQI